MDLSDFIIDLENSAKKILKDVNRKQMEASRIEQIKASKAAMAEKKAAKMAATGKILLSSDTGEIPKTEGLNKTKVLNYSIPKLTVSLTSETAKLLDKGSIKSDKTTSLHSSTLPPQTLSPIRRPSSGSGKQLKAVKSSQCLEKLKSSPFAATQYASLSPLKPRATAVTHGETDWQLKMRATEVLSGKATSKASSIYQHAQLKARDVPTEAQGPIDWSSEGLRMKYRDEMNRELAWQTSQQLQSITATTTDLSQAVLPVAKVDRHPMISLFYSRLQIENTLSHTRTAARLTMKRFVMDVQEVWLTNLQHLAEYRTDEYRHDDDSVEMEDMSLEGRRDVETLKSMNAQIPSVSHPRAMQKSYYTTRPSDPTVEIYYAEGKAPALPPPSPAVPILEPLIVRGFDLLTESGTPVKIFVDRLIDSTTSSWRLQLFTTSGLLQTSTYICNETDVIQCLEDVQLYQHTVYGGRNSNIPTPSAKVLITEVTDTSLPWGGTGELSNVSIRVEAWSIGESSMYSSSPTCVELGNDILVVLSVDLGEQFNNEVLRLAVDPIELGVAIGFGEVPILSTSLAEWFCGLDEEYIDKMIGLLSVMGGDENSDGDPIPARLTISVAVSPVLSSAVSMAYANILLGLIDVSDDLKVKMRVTEGPQAQLPLTIPTSTVTFEAASESNTSLTLEVSGGATKTNVVPGATPLGEMGLWFRYPLDKERTQAAGIFFRNSQISSTDSVLVNMSLALDTPVLALPAFAWEDTSITPPRSQHQPVDGVITTLAAIPHMLLTTPLKNDLEHRISNTVHIFTTAPVEETDFISLRSFKFPKGMFRQLPVLSEKGFRNHIIENLLAVDPVLPTSVFGITKGGATPNATGVHTRSVWHSAILVTDAVNRVRGTKDYHYVLHNDETTGSNDPACFTVYLRGFATEDAVADIVSSAFADYERRYKEITGEYERMARKLALDTKIENSEVLLRSKEKQLENQLRNEAQRLIEKRLRKATKSERGWKKRLNNSLLIEVQGQWERRLDQNNDSFFFHKIVDDENEKLTDTCQWEVPMTWQGDPLSYDAHVPSSSSAPKPVISPKKNTKESSEAFAQPGAVWMPHGEVKHEDKTPGTYATTRRQSVGSVVKMSALEESSTTTTTNANKLAEQLLCSDELVAALAKRLGLPVEQVVPAAELKSMFTLASNSQVSTKSGLLAPREDEDSEIEEGAVSSDDELWSDEEQHVGDCDIDEMGETPANHMEVRRLKKKRENKAKPHEPPASVPFINLEDNGISTRDHDNTKHVAAWRKLPRPEIPAKFFQKCTVTRTLGPDDTSVSNKPNNPVFLVPLSPVDACQYEPETFSVVVESIFIPNAKKDMERVMATVERNIRREEELSRQLPTDDLLLFGQAKEMTSVDNFVAKQYKQDKDIYVDATQEAIEKAVLAAKTNNIAQMEDALEDDIPVDTIDEFGNTLLMLAAQQGSKRMCKYLLRRGANVNSQNLSGNTCLHYCYAYSHHELAKYLISRGADDSILNGHHLTCYEGLSKPEI